MTTTTVTLTPAVLIAVGTSNAGAATTHAARDMRGRHGGLLTAKITNGATAPTVQCIARVLIAHNDGVTPALAGEGVDWKTFAELGGGGIAANAVTPMSIIIPPCCHVLIEFTGNTGQPVTVESMITEYTALVAV